MRGLFLQRHARKPNLHRTHARRPILHRTPPVAQRSHPNCPTLPPLIHLPAFSLFSPPPPPFPPLCTRFGIQGGTGVLVDGWGHGAESSTSRVASSPQHSSKEVEQSSAAWGACGFTRLGQVVLCSKIRAATVSRAGAPPLPSDPVACEIRYRANSAMVEEEMKALAHVSIIVHITSLMRLEGCDWCKHVFLTCTPRHHRELRFWCSLQMR